MKCITCGLGSPSSLNPPATVKSPDNGFSVNAKCVAGETQGCGTNQVAARGLCTPCGYGQVADATYSSCVFCGQGGPSSVNPPATVKYPNDAFSVSATCISAKSANGCGSNQFADRNTGSCAYCPTGQVRNEDGSACTFCGAKPKKASKKGSKGKSSEQSVQCTVKNTNAYVKNARCVAAAVQCGSNQISVLGLCSSCGAGMIPDPSRCACVPCEPCTVKVPNDGLTVNATCVPAAKACGSSAVANAQAQCSPCPINQVADAGRCQCIPCGGNSDPRINPTCSYKAPNDGLEANAVCRPATSCGTSAISSQGGCVPCTYGQVASADGCKCVVCGNNTDPKINPLLSVKFPDANNVFNSSCVAAKLGCGSSQIAGPRGQCVPCSFGMVANADHTACVVCGQGKSPINPPVTVKYPNTNHSANATCVPAGDANGCGTNQVADDTGACTFCTYGKVANADRSQCVVCGQGNASSLNPADTVKAPNNEFVVSARCVAATEGCGTNEFANPASGQCSPCAVGKVADPERRTCVKCGRGTRTSLNPPRTVKAPNNGFVRDAVCVPPILICGTNQIADFNQAACVPCSYGEVASEDRLYCVDCLPQRKCPNSIEAVDAECCVDGLILDLPPG